MSSELVNESVLAIIATILSTLALIVSIYSSVHQKQQDNAIAVRKFTADITNDMSLRSDICSDIVASPDFTDKDVSSFNKLQTCLVRLVAVGESYARMCNEHIINYETLPDSFKGYVLYICCLIKVNNRKDELKDNCPELISLGKNIQEKEVDYNEELRDMIKKNGVDTVKQVILEKYGVQVSQEDLVDYETICAKVPLFEQLIDDTWYFKKCWSVIPTMYELSNVFIDKQDKFVELRNQLGLHETLILR